MKREVTISAVRKIIHDSRYTNATNSNEIDRISLENFTNLTRNIFDAVQKIHLWCTFVGACLRVKFFLIELHRVTIDEDRIIGMQMLTTRVSYRDTVNRERSMIPRNLFW